MSINKHTVYRLIFGFNRWESVKCFICGLGRLNLINIVNVLRVKFYFHLCGSQSLVLSNIFLGLSI